MVYVFAFLSLCWRYFGYVFILVFVLFLVLLSDNEKNIVSPAIVVFVELRWLEGSLFLHALCFCCCVFLC